MHNMPGTARIFKLFPLFHQLVILLANSQSRVGEEYEILSKN